MYIVHQINIIFTDVFFCTSGKYSMHFLWTKESQENQALLKYANYPKGYANTVCVCVCAGMHLLRISMFNHMKPRFKNWQASCLQLIDKAWCFKTYWLHPLPKCQTSYSKKTKSSCSCGLQWAPKKTEDNRCYFKILLNVLKTQKSHCYLPISIFLYTFDDPIKDFCQWNTMIWNYIFCLLF